jgi:hypothetical protein
MLPVATSHAFAIPCIEAVPSYYSISISLLAQQLCPCYDFDKVLPAA